MIMIYASNGGPYIMIREFTQADQVWIARVKTFLHFDHKNTTKEIMIFVRT